MRDGDARFQSMAGTGDAFSQPRETAKRKKRTSKKYFLRLVISRLPLRSMNRETIAG